MRYLDAHAHLNFEAFATDRDAVIEEMAEQKIGAINVGIDLETSRESVELASAHEHIWASVGLHPTEASDHFDISQYHDLIDTSPEVVAVGECGLDYYREENRIPEDKERQRQVFRAHIELAVAHDLPLILHLRPKSGTMDAYEDGLDILEEYNREVEENLRGTAHFFVGDKRVAQRFLELGFYISWTGVVTLTDEFDDVVKQVPLDQVLAETDAPFVAPAPHRGKRNSPLYVPKIIEVVAEKRGESAAKVREQVAVNTVKLFRLNS